MGTYDYVGQIIAYEQGDLNYEDSIALFQYLWDTRLINGLQGSYQRTMARLLDGGLVKNGHEVAQ